MSVDVHVSLLLKVYGYIPVCKRTIVLFSSEMILKQLFPSGSVNIMHLMYGPEGNSQETLGLSGKQN